MCWASSPRHGCLAKSDVGVEKLFPAKFAKIKSCQDVPQTTFSVFLDIFYPPNSCCFEENGVFQQPRLLTSTDQNPRKGDKNGSTRRQSYLQPMASADREADIRKQRRLRP